MSSPPPKSAARLNTFELRRQANIEANQKMMEEIERVKAASVKPEKRATPKKPGRKKAESREPPVPTRKSSRLAGLAPEVAGFKRKRGTGAEPEAQADGEPKRLRISEDLSLGDTIVVGRKYENGMGGLQGLVRGAQPGIRTFTQDDIKKTTDKSLKALRQRMGQLKLYEQWEPNDIKITPTRVYSMGVHPIQDKPVIFAGDKEGSIGIFDASQVAPEVDDEDDTLTEPVISAFKTHLKAVTSFIFSPVDHNSVFTSSYDSSIRKMDLEKETSVQVWSPKDPKMEMCISALDMADSQPNLMYFSTLNGLFGRRDLRTRDEPEIWELSELKIGGFSLHPLQPHLLATASLDRTLKIWDMRKITKNRGFGLPALLGQHTSRLSVSHASWSVGGYVATSSYDNTIKIHNFSDAATWTPGRKLDETTRNMALEKTISHNNQTGRWVTILKPHWQKRPKDGIDKLAIGNMNRFVDIYASDGSQLAQLDGEGISAVPAVAHFHPTLDWVAGGTASGKLCLWM